MTTPTTRTLDLRRLLRRRSVVVVLGLALILGTGGYLRRSDDQTFTAHFRTAAGIYPRDEVRILGVPVGTIESIDPHESDVAVRIRLDSGVKVPADAHAVIVAPSLVSSRYVQLTPQYAGGAVLADGAEIPETHTAVPVEFDQIKAELDHLAVDLGPDGLNKQGALSTFVTTADTALSGKGQSINDTIRELSQTVRVLDEGRTDLFTTVRNLQTFVTLMARSDAQIREFGGRLDTVSTVLADNRVALRQGLAALATTVGDVRAFAKAHRTRVVTTTRGLSDVLGTVAKERKSVEQLLHTGPNTMHNLVAAYHRRDNAVAVGLQLSNTHNLNQLVCGAVAAVSPSAASVAKACTNVLGPLLSVLSGELPLSTELLQQLESSLGGLR